MFNKGLCVICAMPAKKYLCDKHRQRYVFNPKNGVFKLVATKSISKGQTDLFKSVRSIYRIPVFQEVTFEWNPYNRYDIAIMSEKLLIEYDGEQHFKFNKHFHKTEQAFEEYIGKDKEKQEIARIFGWSMVRFSFIEHVEDIDYVEQAIKLKLKNKTGGEVNHG